MALAAPKKMDFTRLQAKHHNTDLSNFMKRQKPQGVRVFCGGDIVGFTGRPHMALKAFQGLHQEDSYYRTARAVDAKIGILVADDMTFHGMPP